MDNYWKNLTEEQYFNEWLEIWNSKCLIESSDSHYLPRGNETNFNYAQQVNQYINDILEADLRGIPTRQPQN